MRLRRPATAVALTAALALSLTPLHAGALLPAGAGAGLGYVTTDDATMTDNVTPVAHIPYLGGSEVDSDGERYLFAGEANLSEALDRQSITQGTGGLRIIDLVGDPAEGVEPFTEVAFLDCAGTDNYVRYMDPAVFNTEAGDREFVVMSFHGNRCTAGSPNQNPFSLRSDPNTSNSYGGHNGIMIVDVTDKGAPFIVDAIGHNSAHTVMPHPTRPYIYILPGGILNGTAEGSETRISPTAIIDASDPTDLRYVTAFTHNVMGCHDLGFSHDGDYAYCAGLGEVQVWDIAGDRIENPLVVGAIHNPAIQFAHNVVVSPSGRYLAINDEAFGFHTCTETAADLYGSLWIYDITVPNVPILAGKISPPGHPTEGNVNVADWTESWCAAHNYNWLPGTDDYIAASWFAGGVTVHDMSNPLLPELVAHYMPHDGVAWSGHYYAGYLVTNDMRRGTEILDVEGLRDLEGDITAATTSAALGTGLAGPRVDLTDVLVPSVLPPRPSVPRDPFGGGFCVLPGSAVRR